MGVDDIIARNIDEQMEMEEQATATRQPEPESSGAQRTESGTLTITLGGPDGDFDREDAVFWLLVVDTLLLLIIALKL